MIDRKLRFLFVQPNFHRHYVTFFPVYEPLHGLLFAGIAGDAAESQLFDRRFDSESNLLKTLSDFAPDIVGLTMHTPGELWNVVRIARLAKQLNSRTITIVGGQHATLLPEDFFDDAIDLICIGPGEETFREVIEAARNGGDFTAVPGLAVRTDGGKYSITPPRVITPGSFSWPVFDRSLLKKKYVRHYIQHFERRTAVYTITTAGCPHRCKFCSLWASARGTYRRRIPAEIVADIASQRQPFVHLTDDNTFDNEQSAWEICRLLKECRIRKKILAYARADTIVKRADLIKAWRDAGLGALVVGMEAVADKHLTSLNKRSTVALNIEAHGVLEELGIENWAHFVIMPDFLREDFEAVWDFVDQHHVTYPVFVPLTPVPGTPFFFEAKERRELTCFDYGFYNLQYMLLRTTLPKREWYEHFADLYRKTCSPRTLWRRRVSNSFHLRPAFFRALVMRSTIDKIRPHIEEQLQHEETVVYDEIEPSLPPSLRRDYVPDKYYNAASVAEMKQVLAEQHEKA